jgi:hypothetical protein
MPKKWSERKTPGRFLRARDYQVGDQFICIITAVGEEELERDGKAKLKTILSLTRAGIGPWGDLVCNDGNLDNLGALFGDDDPATAIGQRVTVRIVMTGLGPGFQIGPAPQASGEAAPPPPPSRPEPPLANTRPRKAKGNSPSPPPKAPDLDDEIPF